MLVLLPILALGACVVALKARIAGWREAILGGAVVWGVTLVGITEALSLVRGVTVAGLASAWLVALLASGGFAVGRAGSRRWGWSPPRVDRLTALLVGPLAAMVLLLGVVAVLSPPNTWDAMTYHMARVIHWSQQAGLAPYPTHILRQLYLQPGAELVLLHLQLLSGGDHLAGLVQWASMVGVLVGTSLIARDLGAGRAGQLCATIFAASLPIGVLESTSTQNDYVVAFWLVCGMACAVRLERASGSEARPARAALLVGLGASVGLALLTKATAYLLVLPIGLWVALGLLSRRRWFSFAWLIGAGALALLLNGGFFARNLVVFGSPIGPLDEGAPTLRYVNDALFPAGFASNLVRAVGVNLNATPLAAINVRAVNFVRLVHTWLGLDIADPRTTWGEEVFREQPAGLAFDENFASNPIHLVLLGLVLVGVAWASVRPAGWGIQRGFGAYALVLVGGFVLFCLVLRWQPWHTRLELPFFVLAAPLVGTVVDRLRPRLAIGLAAGLLVSMLPWVAYNQARPLVGARSILVASRPDQYFANRPSLRSAYLGAVGFLAERGCGEVGFVSGVDGWEYPLWPLLRERTSGPVAIDHIGVQNVSAAHGDPARTRRQPCAVVALGQMASIAALDVDGRAYRPGWGQLNPADVLEQVAVLTVDGR